MLRITWTTIGLALVGVCLLGTRTWAVDVVTGCLSLVVTR